MYLFVNFFCKFNIDWPRIPHHVIMIARASIISECEVSILCLLCSPRYTAVRIKNCSKSMSVIKVATARNTIVPCAPQLSSETEVSIALLCQLCSTCYTAVRIKKCLKSIKSSHYEKYRRFLVMQRKPSRATTKLMLFTVSKDEWNTKEDTGKSL